MTQTVGFYCPVCKIKYVQHRCKEGLPYGHPKKDALWVYAKHYSRGEETVKIIDSSGLRYNTFRGYPPNIDLISFQEGWVPKVSPEKLQLFKEAFEARWLSASYPPGEKIW